MTSDIPHPHVRFVDVVKEYPGRRRLFGLRAGSPDTAHRALDTVTFDIPRGSVLGVVGYSGAGKSTLVRLINALETPTSGSVVVDGTDLTRLGEARLQKVRRGSGMVFQHFNLFASRTVAGNVAYPLRVAGRPRAEVEARVAELLEFVGLADKARSYPSQLSGGQKQRVGIARALAGAPTLLLADEATSALDPETTAEILRLLTRINEEFGTTVVVITHEMAVVREICDSVVVMDGGRVVEHSSAYDVFAAPKTDAGRSFVATASKGAPTPEALQRLRERYPGTIVTVRIDDSFGSPDVTRILDRHGVTGTVVYGDVAEVQNRPLGTLTYELTGESEAVAAAAAALADGGRATTLAVAGADEVAA
ncbi:methionine ABC transporter ATP-binding protein [Brevibacterium yomogidense]|uniref:methionine ABC transporter ATP-binding protein n=1 Tax=Brevibacterium yomogidense TaxID=946573 RepID=UPI0018DF799B|nr:methionine ABC transporter ATP-binding protein [Brevibacterium yomogidense]